MVLQAPGSPGARFSKRQVVQADGVRRLASVGGPYGSRSCDGHGRMSGVKVPYETLLEVIVHRKQLRERQGQFGRVVARSGAGSARARGMEAVGQVLHRAKAKPCKASPSGQARERERRPISSGDGTVVGTAVARRRSYLTPRDLPGSAQAVGSAATQARCLFLGGKGRSRITSHVVMKPGNAGGAREVTS